MVHWTPAEPHFSQLSVIMLDKDRNRPEKPCHVTAYVQIYYEIVVDFFVLDKCFKFTFCSKIVGSCQNLKKLIQTPKVSLKLQSQQSGQALSPLTQKLLVLLLFGFYFIPSFCEVRGREQGSKSYRVDLCYQALREYRPVRLVKISSFLKP